MNIFDIPEIRKQILKYCKIYWLVEIEYEYGYQNGTTTIITYDRLNKSNIEYSLDQYYGESNILYKFINVTHEEIIDIDNYICKHSPYLDHCAIHCFKTFIEFINNGGRMYEPYYISPYEDEDIDQELWYPQDLMESQDLEDLEITKCEWLYIIALYSYKW